MDKTDEVEKMEQLLQKKEKVKTQLIQNGSSHVYTYIDNLFIREIQHSEHYYTYRSAGMYVICRPKPLERFDCGNQVVDDYLNFIFTKHLLDNVYSIMSRLNMVRTSNEEYVVYKDDPMSKETPDMMVIPQNYPDDIYVSRPNSMSMPMKLFIGGLSAIGLYGIYRYLGLDKRRR